MGQGFKALMPMCSNISYWIIISSDYIKLEGMKDQSVSKKFGYFGKWYFWDEMNPRHIHSLIIIGLSIMSAIWWSLCQFSKKSVCYSSVEKSECYLTDKSRLTPLPIAMDTNSIKGEKSLSVEHVYLHGNLWQYF